MTPARETRANGMGLGSMIRPAQGPPLSVVELAHVELAAVDGRSALERVVGKRVTVRDGGYTRFFE